MRCRGPLPVSLAGVSWRLLPSGRSGSSRCSTRRATNPGSVVDPFSPVLPVITGEIRRKAPHKRTARGSVVELSEEGVDDRSCAAGALPLVGDDLVIDE